MAQTGEVNIGQLMRQHFGPENVFILGFGTGTDSVLGRLIAPHTGRG